MQIMLHQSEYLHLHSCARAPFRRSSGLLSLPHLRAISPFVSPPPLCFFSSLFFSAWRRLIRSPIATNSRKGRRKEKVVFSMFLFVCVEPWRWGGVACTYFTVCPVQQQTRLHGSTRYKQVSFQPPKLIISAVALCASVCAWLQSNSFKSIYASLGVERCVLQSNPRCAPPSAL